MRPCRKGEGAGDEVPGGRKKVYKEFVMTFNDCATATGSHRSIRDIYFGETRVDLPCES